MWGRNAAVGEIIRRERKERELTQREVAELCSVSDSYLAHLEAGFRLPSDPISLSLARAFGWSEEQQRRFLQKVEAERVERSRQRIKMRAASVRDIIKNQTSTSERARNGSAPRSDQGETDPELAQAIQHLTSALDDPELRPTVLNALKVFAESAQSKSRKSRKTK